MVDAAITVEGAPEMEHVEGLRKRPEGSTGVTKHDVTAVPPPQASMFGMMEEPKIRDEGRAGL